MAKQQIEGNPYVVMAQEMSELENNLLNEIEEIDRNRAEKVTLLECIRSTREHYNEMATV